MAPTTPDSVAPSEFSRPVVNPGKGSGAGDFVPGRWNLLREDVSLPAAVIYRAALDNNLLWMQRFAESRGVRLAPHGKTTMTPAFFRMQQDAGAWALTLANVPQVAAAFNAGIRRVLMANQLVGRQNMARVSQMLEDPNFDFYCLVDSPDNVEQLAAFFAHTNQRLQVLIEVGVPGGRCGCRSAEEVRALAKAIASHPSLALAGIETYEGVIGGEDAPARITEHLERVREWCQQLLDDGYFATRQVILTGAGSAWYDLVSEVFTRELHPSIVPVIRPGCYLIHDQGIYLEAQAQVLERLGEQCDVAGDLVSSLELWAYVQSRPEPGIAIITLGKRDAAFDAGLPQPVRHYRPGMAAPVKAPANWTLYHIMDQHSALQIPADADLRVGDMLALGTSHPCLTFDKWRTLHLVDDQFNVIDQLHTYF